MSLSHIAIPDGDVVRARRDPESTHRSEPRLKASMSVQPGETTTVVVSHNLPTHDRVLLEPKKTTALGIYTAVTDDATGHVVVYNPGTRVVAIQQNQQVIQEENTTIRSTPGDETQLHRYYDSGDAEERRQLEQMLREYSQVFVDKGFARVPEEE
ncbi:hypothetical protein E4U45_004456 [Claviceps purpurea]|nr:hypothetical protein E4U45_004456 [Claviceps purpurea]